MWRHGAQRHLARFLPHLFVEAFVFGSPSGFKATLMARRILLVDDAPELLEVYQYVLEDAGYEVYTASSPARVRDLVKSWHPDAVLTDLCMPELSGLELISQLRRTLPSPQPPIGALSGFPELEAEALNRGADAFQSKPLEPDGLLLLVDSLLRRIHPPDVLKQGAEQRRKAAAKLAHTALESTVAKIPDFVERVGFAARYISRYFEGLSTVVLLLQDDDLRVMASSNPQVFPLGASAKGLLTLTQDVIESGSSLVITDPHTRGAFSHDHAAPALLVSAPLRAPHGTVVGALALTSEHIRPFDAHDLAILESFARRGAAILFGRALGFVLQGLHAVEPDMWHDLLQHELLHVRRGRAMALLILEGDGPAFWEFVRNFPVDLDVSHMAMTIRHSHQLSVFKLDDNMEVAASALGTVLGELKKSCQPSAGAQLKLQGLESPEDVDSITELTESLLEKAKSRGSGQYLVGTITTKALEL